MVCEAGLACLLHAVMGVQEASAGPLTMTQQVRWDGRFRSHCDPSAVAVAPCAPQSTLHARACVPPQPVAFASACLVGLRAFRGVCVRVCVRVPVCACVHVCVRGDQIRAIVCVVAALEAHAGQPGVVHAALRYLTALTLLPGYQTPLLRVAPHALVGALPGCQRLARAVWACMRTGGGGGRWGRRAGGGGWCVRGGLSRVWRQRHGGAAPCRVHGVGCFVSICFVSICFVSICCATRLSHLSAADGPHLPREVAALADAPRVLLRPTVTCLVSRTPACRRP
jgi:hypothetical protein